MTHNITALPRKGILICILILCNYVHSMGRSKIWDKFMSCSEKGNFVFLPVWNLSQNFKLVLSQIDTIAN